MPKTILQTAEFIKANSPLVFHTICERPVVPDWVHKKMAETKEPVGIHTPQGDKIIWSADGSASVVYKNGDSAFFEAPPNLAYAIKNINKGDFYQFHPDKSVTCRIDGKTYYYSAPYEATPMDSLFGLRKLWDSEQQTWLSEHVDLTPEEFDEKQKEEWLEETRSRTYSDYDDYDDGGPRCCRGCWKNLLTPEQKEEMEIDQQLRFYELILEKYTKEAAEGDEAAKEHIEWYTECQKKAQERAAAFEVKKATKAAAV